MYEDKSKTDPMVGSAATNSNNQDIISDSSDNADLLDFCFLCSLQFFHDNLDNYGTERLKDEDVLETFFEELGPVDRALLQCCPACKALCKTLIKTRDALSSLIDEITRLLLRSRKVSFLLSKSRVVSRLFQSSNSSLPPCENSSSYLQPLSQMNFVTKDGDTSNNANNPTDFLPTRFDLRLDSSNLSMGMDLDLGLASSTPISVIKRSPLCSNKVKRGKDMFPMPMPELVPSSTSSPSPSPFSSIYTDSIMNSVSDNACDISEGVIRHHQRIESKVKNDIFLPPSFTPPPRKMPVIRSPQKGWKRPNQDVSKALTFENSNTTATTTTNDSLSIQPNEPDSLFESLIMTDSSNQNPPSEISTQENFPSSSDFAENKDIPLKIKKSRITKPSPSKNEEQKQKLSISKHVCNICNKSFKCGRNLRNHLTSHQQERKYICEICGVSYRHKFGLDSHVAIHEGNPKFRCEICNKIFTQNSGLQRHLRIHTGRFQFQCDHCGKQFLHHSSFRAHKLIHEGGKDYRCPQCESSFSHKSHLIRHMRIHTGEKRYKCHLCERSFSEGYNLQVHLKTHEDDPNNLFKCQKCIKTFTRKFKLKQHMSKVHCSFTL